MGDTTTPTSETTLTKAIGICRYLTFSLRNQLMSRPNRARKRLRKRKRRKKRKKRRRKRKRKRLPRRNSNLRT